MNDAATPTITVMFEITEEDAVNLARFLLVGLDAAGSAEAYIREVDPSSIWESPYPSIQRVLQTILLALPH